MPELASRILVVSNPGDQDDILEPLIDAGFRGIDTGDGSDETLSQYEQARPDVVVLSADLAQGDARALISAMREGPHGNAVQIILIGEANGPIRNALDAADLAVNRFLARPLSAKALVFSVRTCLEAAAARATMTQSSVARPPAPVRHTRISEWDDDSVSSGTLVGAPSPDRGPGPLRTLDWDMPAPATPRWREPTLILPEGGEAPAELPNATMQPAALDEAVGEAADEDGATPLIVYEEGPWGAGLVSSALPESLPISDHGSGLDNDVDELSAHLASDLADELASDSELDHHIADLDDGTAGGGEFARALRRKMSAMAERLFPGQHAGAVVEPAGAGVEPAPAVVPRARTEPISSDAELPGAVRVPDRSKDIPDEVLEEVMGGPVVEAGLLRHGESDVAMLLERMYRQRFTGRITFLRLHTRKSILFENGRPVFASSNLPEDRLGELLYREGKITDSQHDDGYLRAIESGKRMAEVLVEMGYLKRRELLPTVRRHLEDVVYSLFAWDSGEYEVVAGSFAMGERIRISRHPAAMILEGVRRKLDRELLTTLVGETTAVMEIIDDKQLKAVMSVADLSPVERKVISLFDGKRSIAEVVEQSGIDLQTAYQLAYGLIVMKAAQAAPPRTARAAVPRDAGAEAVGQPEPESEPEVENEVSIDRQRVLAKLSLVTEADYFALLGVRRDATSFEIQRAYQSARHDYASDGFSPEVRSELGTEIAEINAMLDEAYRVLRDDALRNAYRSNLRE